MTHLSPQELTALGRAFEHGYEAPRAKRLIQEGLGVTPMDDLALALGYPMLVELGPDVDDPAGYARARIIQPLRRLEPWPKNAAVRAARALFLGWEVFPEQMLPEAEAELDNAAELTRDELPGLFAAYFDVPPSAWHHALELLFLVEALAGGDALLAATLPLIEQKPREWSVVQILLRSVILALGMVMERLPDTAAAAHRERFGALLQLYRKKDADLANARLTGLPLRAIDLILNGAEGYARSAPRREEGPGRHFDSHFLDRDPFHTLTQPTGPHSAHAIPSVQWVVQGGPDECANLGDWTKLESQGSREEAQRYLVRAWGRVALPGSAELLADMYGRSLVKAEVVEVARHVHRRAVGERRGGVPRARGEGHRGAGAATRAAWRELGPGPCRSRLKRPGDRPVVRLNVRAKAGSDAYPVASATSATERSVLPSSFAARLIRQSIRYCRGGTPSRVRNRSASAEREVPARRASSATVHSRAQSRCIASSARRSPRSPA